MYCILCGAKIPRPLTFQSETVPGLQVQVCNECTHSATQKQYAEDLESVLQETDTDA